LDEAYRHFLELVVSRVMVLLLQAQAHLEISKRAGVEESFTQAFQACPEALAITRRKDGIIVEINPGFEKLLGYSRKEALGRAPEELNLYLDPLDRQQILDRFVAEGFLRGYELDVQTKSGDIRHITLSVESFLVDNEPCLLNILHDITDQKLVQERLGLSEEQFARAFSVSPDALIIGRYPDGSIYEVNHSFESLFGYSREAVVGKSWTDLNLYVDLADRQQLLSQFKRQGFLRDYELRLQSRSGKTRYISLSVEPIIIDDKLSVLNILRDITQKEQGEAALQLAEERLRIALKNAPIVVFSQDTALRYTWIYNPRPGFYPEAVIGKTDDAIFLPREAYQLSQIKRQILQTGVGVRLELPLTLVDVPFTYDFTLEPMIDPSGIITGLTGAAINITALQSTEEALQTSEAQRHRLAQTLEQRVAERTAELQEAFHHLDQATGTLAYNLEAPLRRISQLVAWIAADTEVTLPGDLLEHLAQLQEQIEQIEKRLSDLWLYSRLRPPLSQSKERVDSGALVKHLIDALAPPASFTIMVQEAMPSLMTNRALLELVFKNLIENAIKHHHQANGRIKISAHEGPDFIQFSVADDGPGLEPTLHKRLFQILQVPPFRAEREKPRVGLALVKQAVESQGGTIDLASAPGEGSIFRFTWSRS
jgi:PAS domain S-box-containing protein